jgi:hypothetical protein
LLSSLAVYSLPNDFTQAAFDYNFYLGRNGNGGNQYIILTFPRELYGTIETASIISELKGFIQFENGQVFEMSRYECPMFYAAKVNPPSTYQSLKIIKNMKK